MGSFETDHFTLLSSKFPHPTTFQQTLRQNREMMLERQREGIAKSKAAGKYKGRKPIAQAAQSEVIRLAELGITKASIAQKLKLGEATVYRVLAAAKKERKHLKTITIAF